MVKILIDDRELNGPNRFDLELQDYGYEVIVQRQEIDFEIPEFGIGIERKTAQDFQSSVYNGAIFGQMQRLAELCIRPYLLIDGDVTKFPPKWYFGTVLSLEDGYRRGQHYSPCYVHPVFGCVSVWIDCKIRKFMSDGVKIDPIRRQHLPKEATPQERINHTLLTLPGIGWVKVGGVQGLKLIPAIKALSEKVKPDFREWLE